MIEARYIFEISGYTYVVFEKFSHPIQYISCMELDSRILYIKSTIVFDSK